VGDPIDLLFAPQGPFDPFVRVLVLKGKERARPRKPDLVLHGLDHHSSVGQDIPVERVEQRVLFGVAKGVIDSVTGVRQPPRLSAEPLAAMVKPHHFVPTRHSFHLSVASNTQCV
jgi:hypothetical protein